MAATEKQFAETYDALRKILKPYEPRLAAQHDRPGSYYLDTRTLGPNGQPMFFGAVRLGSKYVSYHLMPVYVNPALLEAASPELRRRMQGKSCFNFTKPDYALFRELEELTRAGFADFEAAGRIG